MNELKNKDAVPPRFVSATELQRHCGLGRNTARDMAEQAHAVVRVGRRVVFDVIKFDEYMATLAK